MCLFSFPVDIEGRNIKSFSGHCLPACIGPHWTNDINIMIEEATHHDFGVHIAGVKQMSCRRQLAICQCLVDWRGLHEPQIQPRKEVSVLDSSLTFNTFPVEKSQFMKRGGAKQSACP